MAAKVTSVKLVVPQHEIEQTFEVGHAEALLNMKNNGGWQLPADSDYEFTNGTISKRDKGKSKQGKE